MVRTLTSRQDDRGVFQEIFREEWKGGLSPVQWNVVHSKANVLRGVHVHKHTDYLSLISGKMLLGLHDLRPKQEKMRLSEIVLLDTVFPLAITIPPGVCHGFYFLENSVHIYAVNSYWSPNNEFFGCRFNAPELRLNWPNSIPLLSKRDESLSSYEEMREKFISACDNMK